MDQNEIYLKKKNPQKKTTSLVHYLVMVNDRNTKSTVAICFKLRGKLVNIVTLEMSVKKIFISLSV